MSLNLKVVNQARTMSNISLRNFARGAIIKTLLVTSPIFKWKAEFKRNNVYYIFDLTVIWRKNIDSRKYFTFSIVFISNAFIFSSYNVVTTNNVVEINKTIWLRTHLNV